jgi:transposase
MSTNCTFDLLKDLQDTGHREMKDTSLDLLAVHNYLQKLNFTEAFNEHLTWDEKQWKISPGELAKSVIFLPYVSRDRRISLYRVGESYKTVDMNLLFEGEFSTQDLTDDSIGRMLDRFHESGCTQFFTQLALSVYSKLGIDFSKYLHGDTTSHVLYGMCNTEPAQNSNAPIPKYGHSKDHRSDLKQINMGMVTDGNGLPIYSKILDGNTADCVWNHDTITELSTLLGDRLLGSVYVADSKLVTMRNLEAIASLDCKLQFISRSPASFNSKITQKIRDEAYENGDWNFIGAHRETPTKNSTLAEYEAMSFCRKINGSDYRLIAYRSDAKEHLVDRKKETDKESLDSAFAKRFSGKKKTFACEKDAKNDILKFKAEHKKNLYDISCTITERVEYKKPRGRPGKNPKPPVKNVQYAVELLEIAKNQVRIADYRKKTQSFVLITNVPESEMDERAILHTYKEQKVVEDNFSIIKRPVMAGTLFVQKPERLEALMILLCISLLLQIAMKLIVKKNLSGLDHIPNLDVHRKPLINPSSRRIIEMIRNYSVITWGDKQEFVIKNSLFADGLATWVYLLGLGGDQLLSQNQMGSGYMGA